MNIPIWHTLSRVRGAADKAQLLKVLDEEIGHFTVLAKPDWVLLTKEVAKKAESFCDA